MLCTCGCSCLFLIKSFGLLHLTTLLIGAACIAYGFMSHFHSSWVNKEEYKLCEESEKVWMMGKEISCPDISLETAFLIMVVTCFAISLLVYLCEIFFIGGSKTTAVCYVAFLCVMAGALMVAGTLYIRSAILINNLPSPDYTSKVRNIARVLVATVSEDKKINLISQSPEQTYFEEKITTGCLTFVNGLLHLCCAWLTILDLKPGIL
ncbi:hypothetical protein Ocin01_13638 [Orchesella cincta]|uniref:Uncharacterized protein n=1 Tax=Orchesella cincta TaxID=48709 RepID=A0A1D2MJ43_ORCCI|nr:hypothetical protein Ocin01_13638 [Orchesella cincta]